MEKEPKFLTIKQLASDEAFPFNENTIRHWIKTREKNGMNMCLRRVGRRYYINRPAFIQWIESKAEAPKLTAEEIRELYQEMKRQREGIS